MNAATIEQLAEALHRSYNDSVKDKYGKTTWDMLVTARKDRWREVARQAFIEVSRINREESLRPNSEVALYEHELKVALVRRQLEREFGN